MSPILDAPDPRAELGPHSDIWSLGAIMNNLMSLVNERLRANDVRKLLNRRLRRCYYSRVLTGLVQTCLRDDHNQRPIAYDIYKITRYYAAKHKERADNAAAHAATHAPGTRQSIYLQQVLFGSGQDTYKRDPQFQEAYASSNLAELHALIDYLRGDTQNEAHLHPNEIIPAPGYLDLSDILHAGQLSHAPSPDLLQQPFRDGFKRYLSNVNDPFEPDRSDTDDDNNENGGGLPDPRPPHDGVPPAQQLPQLTAVDNRTFRAQGNASRTRESHPALVRSPDSFATFEPATLQRSPSTGDRSIVRRPRTVIDVQVSIDGRLANVHPSESQAYEARPADESINEQPGRVRRRSISFSDDPPTHGQPRRFPSADEAVVPGPFDLVPPITSPPQSDAPAPSPPTTQTAASDAPQPQASNHPSSTPAGSIQRVSSPPESPPANAPQSQTTSQRSSISSGLSSVPSGPILTPSPPHQHQPSNTLPPPTSTESSPLSSAPSTWPFSPLGPASSHHPSTTSSPLSAVPPGPITRPFSVLEERYLFRNARPARQAALQRLAAMQQPRPQRQARRTNRRRRRQEEVAGGMSKAERQAGEREERAAKRQRR